jgi:hypothetical protein
MHEFHIATIIIHVLKVVSPWIFCGQEEGLFPPFEPGAQGKDITGANQ